jgi:hypothetical protein
MAERLRRAVMNDLCTCSWRLAHDQWRSESAISELYGLAGWRYSSRLVRCGSAACCLVTALLVASREVPQMAGEFSRWRVRAFMTGCPFRVPTAAG